MVDLLSVGLSNGLEQYFEQLMQDLFNRYANR